MNMKDKDIKDPEKRYTSYLPVSLIQKLLYIAWHDRQNIKDVFAGAVSAYIKAYEKKNGLITAEQLKEADIK